MEDGFKLGQCWERGLPGDVSTPSSTPVLRTAAQTMHSLDAYMGTLSEAPDFHPAWALRSLLLAHSKFKPYAADSGLDAGPMHKPV